MRIIVSGLRNCDTPTALYPPLDVFNGIGSLTFDQLSKLRHRGAFATVTSTFSTCCQLTQKLTDAFPDMPKSLDHLRAWYEVGYCHQCSGGVNIDILAGSNSMHHESSINNPALGRYPSIGDWDFDSQRRVTIV